LTIKHPRQPLKSLKRAKTSVKNDFDNIKAVASVQAVREYPKTTPKNTPPSHEKKKQGKTHAPRITRQKRQKKSTEQKPDAFSF
jgi:hypothetical protein